MEKALLIANPGSASKKYSVFLNAQLQLTAHYENEGADFVVSISGHGVHKKIGIDAKEYQQSVAHFSKLCEEFLPKKISFAKIGVRLVAPGINFQKHQLVDKNFLAKLKKAEPHDPVHIKIVEAELAALAKVFAKTKIFAVSDSAFHANLPRVATTYAIPQSDADKFELRRFGYHGLSVQSVMRKLNHNGNNYKRVVVCHLGSGASVTAVKDNLSFDTSMGFTPLEGLAMSTRVGDIDPGALLYLGRQLKLNYQQLEDYLYHESGLKGLAGSPDLRELLSLEGKGDKAATLAIELYVYRIKKYIGAYAAVMDGLDAAIFTGTVGLRSQQIRSRVCNGLHGLGLYLDERANDNVRHEGVISTKESRVNAFVLESDENQEIMHVLQDLK